MSAPVEITYIGASWCSTCKTIKPAIVALAQRYTVALRELDYDDDMEEDEKNTIKKVPTIRIRRGGVQVAEFTVRQVDSVREWLTENMSLSAASSDDF